MDIATIKDIEKFIEENEERMFRDMARLVGVNSVKGESEEGAPFGRGPAEALKTALAISEELGLRTENCENIIGYAQVGEGEDYLATICHVDVVPAGNGWTGDPFTLREREGYLIGRGIMDDKGPAVLCMYALKYLEERAETLRYPVRALFGTNEETGMADVEYYSKNHPAPVFCISPDSNFPVCVGEKGMYKGKIVSRAPVESIVKISGGAATNVVPDECEAWVKADKLESTENVEATTEGTLWHLKARGIGGHASLPAGTVNAIGVMINYLLENKVASGEEEAFLRALSRLHASTDGSTVGAQADDGFFTPLTMVGGVIDTEEKRIFQTIDCRYPTSTNAETIAAALRKAMGDSAEIRDERDTPPFRMDEKNPAVQSCLAVYNAVTGENGKCYTMGGGTYARRFPNAVAFGPEHPERVQPDFAGPIHGADEAASKEAFIEALKIYILALLELEKLDY